MLPQINPGLLLAFACCLCVLGCHRDLASEASDSDANGYLCDKCGAKLYTDRSNFIGPECPKCHQQSLVEVIGNYCEKDQHVTVRPRTGDRSGGPLCERCQGPTSGIKLPREKDLKAWGATKQPA